MPFRTALGGARMRVTTAALGLAVAGCLSASAPAVAAATAATVLDAQEQAACRQINAFRAANGVAPLKVSPTLTKAARWMSADMAANDYIGHVDSRGRDFSLRIGNFGFRSATRGENLAAGEGDAAATVEQWKDEPAHRRNMLRASYKVMGVGRASAGSDSMFGWYWTTTFGAGRERAVAC
jgi:uncharacterized protein YkwD